MTSSDHKFTLTIDLPSAGWVDVTVTCGGREICFGPSYISDAIGDLILAAAGLAERRCGWGGETRFDWQDEPGAWRWKLTPRAGDLHIHVEMYSENFPGPDAAGESLLDEVVPGRRFCNAVLRAMDTVAGQMSEEKFEEEWGFAFPTAGVERLRSAVREWD